MSAFATAYAMGKAHIAFLVGVSSSLGAGISMGMSEGLSDDGSITGRGSATLRGIITGAATFIGGILHTLPFGCRMRPRRCCWLTALSAWN